MPGLAQCFFLSAIELGVEHRDTLRKRDRSASPWYRWGSANSESGATGAGWCCENKEEGGGLIFGERVADDVEVEVVLKSAGCMVSRCQKSWSSFNFG